MPLGGGQTRPLPPLEEYSTSPSRLKVGQTTHVGQQRSNNQDSLLAMTTVIESSDSPSPFSVFIVADGMGGHIDGERASMQAAQTLASYVTRETYLPLLEGAQELDADQKTIPEVLEEGVKKANEIVTENVPDGGTTVTAAVIHGNLLYVAHVGDSRAYLIVGGNMERITRDHSLVARLIELEQLTPEEAEVHPQRNVLYKAIGQGEVLDVDRATRRLPPGSKLLLCSDGLWGVVDEAEILRIIEENTEPQVACDMLIESANQNGGPDNITAVLVQMPR